MLAKLLEQHLKIELLCGISKLKTANFHKLLVLTELINLAQLLNSV